jgi:hypothetical protein
MNKALRNSITSTLLLLPVAIAFSTLPVPAIAQPAAPEVRGFEIEADAGLEAGSMLRFRLVGTPRAQATVHVRGVAESIALREARPGTYIGRYTLKRGDRVAPNSAVRAMLRHGNRSAVADYELGQAMGLAPSAPAAPVARPPDPVRIDRFGMVAVDRIEPGVELQFAVEGMPGAAVTVDLPGVDRDVRLRETRPGHYEGTYTIRRSDTISANRPAVATLRAGERVATANLNMLVGRAGGGVRPPGVDQRPPNLVQLVPGEGATVPAGAPVQIAAVFEDGRGTGVDPSSVRVTVSGRNMTADAQINPGSFSLRTALPAGRHTVEVVARDQAGNAVRKSWSFEVAAAAPVNVPLRVLNFRSNDQVGSGPIVVQGHTVPRAMVEVRVTASAPSGWPLEHELLSRSVQADHNGNFSFSFAPQTPVPGGRYQITLVSTRGNVRDEENVVLIQR